MKNLILLGATGSIGQKTLECLRDNKKYRLVAITFNSNIGEAKRILKSFKTIETVGVSEVKAAKELKGYEVEVFTGKDANLEVIRKYPDAIIFNALSGASGIAPSFEAVKLGHKLLLANKETLIVGGKIFSKLVKKHKSVVYPIDSEHSALYKLLKNYKSQEIEKLIITASGGALRDMPLDCLDEANTMEVLAHPTYQMGAKITIDSATLVNKAFEVIEAEALFSYPVEKVEVLMHDESLIHAGLRLIDGSFVFESCPNDMLIPIAYALNDMKRVKVKDVPPLDLPEEGTLRFREFDSKRYPLFEFVLECYQKGGTSMAIIVGSDDVATKAFLDGTIKYTDIAKVIMTTYQRVRIAPLDSYEDIEYSLKLAIREAGKVVSEIVNESKGAK